MSTNRFLDSEGVCAHARKWGVDVGHEEQDALSELRKTIRLMSNERIASEIEDPNTDKTILLRLFAEAERRSSQSRVVSQLRREGYEKEVRSKSNQELADALDSNETTHEHYETLIQEAHRRIGRLHVTEALRLSK